MKRPRLLIPQAPPEVYQERPCQTVFFSHPSRSDMLSDTIHLFLDRESDIRGINWCIWTGHDIPSGPVGQHKDVTDLIALLASPMLTGRDLLFLEDDIEPCRNALRYMVSWDCARQSRVTSFYNPSPGRKLGFNHGFIFSQALKIPWRLIERIRAEPFPPPHPKLQRDGIDQIIDRYLKRWSMPFYQHRSLVEHRGDVSTWDDRLRLTDPGRSSADWVGPTVDALTFKWAG